MLNRKTIVVMLLGLSAGCSSGSSGHSSAPTPSPAALTGTAAFLEFAHQASFGTKDFAGADDSALLDLGNNTCEGFISEGLSFGRVVQGLVESDGKPTTSEAEALVRAAVEDLCPEQSSSLP